MSAAPPPAAAASPAPLRKRFRAGTHRLVSPDETVARVRPLLPVLGITRVAHVTGLDTLGIPVVMVCRPNAKSLSVAQGKGLDLSAARASGIMESIEVFHAENITLPLKLATRNQLRFTHDLCDVAALPRYSSCRFHDNLKILWIEARDLMSGAPSVWLPYEMVHADYTLPLPSGAGNFFMSTSGLASGNHLLEATCHAICEVVERDAATLFHLASAAQRQSRRLALDSVDDPDGRALLDRYARAGVEAAVWDMTSDAGIAAFKCIIRDRDTNPFRLIPSAGGHGCHPSRAVALSRALTEAAQSRLTLIAGSRDDIRGTVYGPEAHAASRALLDAELAWPAVPRRFSEVPTREHDSIDEDLAFVLGRLSAIGLRQVLSVELTRPELGIPVVRVVIPGLEATHDAPHWTPGARAVRVLAEQSS
ncbi:YcaO-like family protein [Myxococcota bacterium]|nr:YcaO-like family protein [Myxococcota bacterium]